MLMAIIAMWMSTVAYWIATLLVAVETQLTLRDIMTHTLANIDQARSCVGFSFGGRPFMDCQSESPVKEVPNYLEVHGTQQCIGTVALTINVSVYPDLEDQRLTPVLSGHHRGRRRLVARLGAMDRPPGYSYHLDHPRAGHNRYALRLRDRNPFILKDAAVSDRDFRYEGRLYALSGTLRHLRALSDKHRGSECWISLWG